MCYTLVTMRVTPLICGLNLPHFFIILLFWDKGALQRALLFCFGALPQNRTSPPLRGALSQNMTARSMAATPTSGKAQAYFASRTVRVLIQNWRIQTRSRDLPYFRRRAVAAGAPQVEERRLANTFLFIFYHDIYCKASLRVIYF